jgi:hypothetical protein
MRTGDWLHRENSANCVLATYTTTHFEFVLSIKIAESGELTAKLDGWKQWGGHLNFEIQIEVLIGVDSNRYPHFSKRFFDNFPNSWKGTTD